MKVLYVKNLALVRVQERVLGDTGDHYFSSGLVGGLFVVDLGPGAATLPSLGFLNKSLFSWLFGLSLVFLPFWRQKEFLDGQVSGQRALE